MIYYLAQELLPSYGFLNVFTYHTVRAGGALITGFLFCLLVGPRMIEMLRALKIGQHIKKDHVQDLHELHKSKAGTPTMGGAIIIVSALLSLFLWSTLTNRLLLAAMGVLVVLGGVGFLDDYLKLRRKHNDGLSAKAKIIGQVLAGGALGVFVVFFPLTYGASYLSSYEIREWSPLANAIQHPSENPLGHFRKHFSPELRETLEAGDLGATTRRRVIDELNTILRRTDIYDAEAWNKSSFNGETSTLLAKKSATLTEREAVRLNRLLLEAAAPNWISRSPRNLQTKVGIPGIKDVLIPLGLSYIFFVILIIVGASNAVNLTDGLDGLATGASVISIFAFTAIAYIVSRADWSEYLYVFHVPEASELTVFGAAMLGTGLGFLWFNAYPAEVFMGDTGSLALGGVIGAMAVLTKQELLLPIVGGLFVLEAGSVILQVASFKLRGKRIFRMAPLHHHFELKGWSESKVTIRFWILALVFALMSLSTLKLR